MSQTIIVQSEEILVVEQDSTSSVVTTETETILLVEEVEVVILEIAEQGPAGPAGEAPTTWGYYAVHWTTAPAQVTTTAAGAVYSYTLGGTTRYRLVPSPYVAAQDAFYSAWDGAALSGLIVSRVI